MIAPYVDEEVAFAVRYHQVLRFYPDEAFRYKYPDFTLHFDRQAVEVKRE